jgi:methyl-accepting chemotaxis protein
MQHDIPAWVYIVFTAVTAAGVVMQALVLLGMLFAVKAAMARLDDVTKQAQEHALPALATARHFLEEVSPKLKVAAQNVLEVSETLKHESTHVTGAVDELLKKAEVQVDRVDEMVTGTLDSIAYATATVQRAVVSPMRQVGAVLSGLRAGFDVLRSKDRNSHEGADGDHFV